MKEADLSGSLLASVSRSFYLTIRILPAVLRAPIGLAYLLARASDTIADSAEAPAAVRLRHLAAFEAMIATGTREGLAELTCDIQTPHPGEQALIVNLGRCLDWLAAQTEEDRAEIVAVMRKIIRGQTGDLERFTGGQGIAALATAAELEDYTYLVAGCVGEFWTRICVQHLPRYASLDLPELCRLGVNYGKGLQLVNILRDAPADLRAGRCYLPEDELRAIGVAPASLLGDPKAARPVFGHWSGRAREHLEDGFRYLTALRPVRLRVGCFLPWYLGMKTLQALHARPALEASQKIKVPRSTVRSAMLLAIPVAFSNTALAKVRAGLCG